ncbi:MAG TPA: GTPase domain-containing protein, partial [Tepidisphaeraceae bacterium]|nr:GTPase domain-containing protein [Tepidisphaeraceae bacterium]
NRLLDANLTATSFRRTFTAGAVAIARDSKHISDHWLGIDARSTDPNQLPARGEPDALTIVPSDNALLRHVTLIDTPDLDGDQPAHHLQADRVFRWAEAILFLVTPEKYQMTELWPYYRLARRYALPALFVMNKVEAGEPVEDYAKQLRERAQIDDATVYAVPRDDAAFEPSPDANLVTLRETISHLARPDGSDQQQGICARLADWLDRLRDQAIAPMRRHRQEADRLIQTLRAMEAPAAGIDVHPLTQQLYRRLQQRSVLYLMGPGKMFDRVRQVPGMIARLPRTAWDLLKHGQVRMGGEQLPAEWKDRVPDFHAALVDQFTVVQSRIDDALRSSDVASGWLSDRASDYATIKMNPADAGKIADEELAGLREWLEKKWNATPRDTAILMRLLKLLPGGDKLTKWSEAAPYLLAIVVATHHAFFGPVDLLVIGGFSLATWLTEKISNEVAARARVTNQRIAQRFEQLAHEQVQRVAKFIDEQAPKMRQIDQLERQADELSESVAACQADAG